ncbi:MAG: carbohydrate-binding protein [Planctomycetota bacterium]|nr:carbohydrate-binding protein [Planctomycetota bacterium]
MKRAWTRLRRRTRGGKHRQVERSPRPCAEPLEQRCLLAVTGTLPVLMIVVEGGPGSEHDMHPDHDLAYFRQIFYGAAGSRTTAATAVNYSDTPGESAGHFDSDVAFPDGNGDHFAIKATALLRVTPEQEGIWTFGINSDDGARLRIDGMTIITDDALHPAEDHLASVYVPAGTHSLELVYFEYDHGATVELMAAWGIQAAFNSGFSLITSETGPGLRIDARGFDVWQRFSAEPVDSLADADKLLAEPLHNVVDYFKENSHGNLKLVPAMAGDLTDGGSDGIVGIYTYPTYETIPEKKRRLSVQLADADFDFSKYDTNGNKILDPNELLIITIGSDQYGNEHWWDLRAYDDFDATSFTRSTLTEVVSGRHYDLIRGKLKSDGTWADYQNRYYAHPNGPKDYWTEAQARAHVTNRPWNDFHRYASGANCRTPDQNIVVDGITINTGYLVAGVGDWTEWINIPHELTHLLQYWDVLDLYNLPGSSKVNNWVTMGATLNMDGSVHHDPWTKQTLGWVNPTVISSPGWYTLSDVETTGQVLRVQRNASECFLIENRWWGTSYDAPTTARDGVPGLAGSRDGNLRTAPGLPGQGLAIWHIDETRLPAFKAGTHTSQFLVKEDIGNPNNGSDDLLGPGETFSAVSTANSNWNDGMASNIVISDVSTLGPNVTFHLDFTGVPRDRMEPNDRFEFARSLGAGDQTIQGLSIHRDNDDYFMWTAAASGTLNIDLSFTHALGDVDVSLHGSDDSHTEITQSNSTTDHEHMSAAVTKGQSYFIRVWGNGGAVNPDYDMTIDGPDILPDRFEPNNDWQHPFNFGVGNRIEQNLTIHEAGGVDFYRWVAAGAGALDVRIFFTHANGNLDLFLYDGTGSMVRQSAGLADNEYITGYYVQPMQVYYIAVVGAGGSRHHDYSIQINGPAIPQDRFEPNGHTEQAPLFYVLWVPANLGMGDRSDTGLTIDSASDHDFYAWTAPAEGQATISVAFQHDLGDLDLYVRDGRMDYSPRSLPIAYSSSDSGSVESVTLNVAAGKTYYISVVGAQGPVTIDPGSWTEEWGFCRMMNASYTLTIDGPEGPQTPYSGSPIPVPGYVQAEHFDLGGQGVAYYDNESNNWGGQFRPTEGVDLEICGDPEGGWYNVGWTNPGEWLEYTIDVASSGMYDLELRMAAGAGAEATYHIEFNGLNKTGSHWIWSTGGWQTWETATYSPVYLDAGTQVMRIVFDEGTIGANINWIRFTGPQYSYPSGPPQPPCIIQVEDFDTGGEGIAYHDSDGVNAPFGAYRPSEGVDIEPTGDIAGGGFNVGWIDPGEWLEYTLNIPARAMYDVELRYATSLEGIPLRIEFVGRGYGESPLQNTGGWQSYVTQWRFSALLEPGLTVLRLTAPAGGLNLNWIRVTPHHEPFNGIPLAVPGLIQAEEYDFGANGLSYFDDSPGNSPGEYYRQDDVDIDLCGDIGGTYNIGSIRAGEWLDYTIEAYPAGNYDMEFRVAHPGAGGTFHAEIDGVDVTGPLNVPDTRDWQSYKTILKTAVPLKAGKQVLRIVFDTPGSTGYVCTLNWIRITPHHAPYLGGPVAVPARIEVENFDRGPNGVAYSDTDALNTGVAYRTWEDVDIRATADTGGGYQVGWTGAGEWLDYTINVPAAGPHDVDIRYASGNGGTFHISFGTLDASGNVVNLQDKTGPVTVTTTGGWDSWQTMHIAGISLAAGVQVMRLVFDSGWPIMDLNWIYIQPAPAIFQFDSDTYQVAEDSVKMTITVTRTGNTAGSASVRYGTKDGTALQPGDYTPAAGLLEFGPGELSRTFDVLVVDDSAPELNETIELTLSDPSNSLLGAPSSAVLTILDNDVPTLSIEDPPAVTEGNSGLKSWPITLKLSSPSAKQVRVQCDPADGSAKIPDDYLADTSLVVFFDPGQVSKTIEVWIKGDMLDEDDERFFLSLSNPVNAAIVMPQATITILDDDPAPTLSVNDPPAVVEGNSGTTSLTFTVSLSSPSGRPVTVQYQTADGSATAPADYTTVAPTTLTFDPGQTSKPVTVQIKGDLIDEDNEQFQLILSNPTNAAIADSQGIATITDDDTAGITVNPTSGLVTTEAGGKATFTVVLDSPPLANVTIGLTSSDTTEGTVAPASLTFTAANWNVVQTVTVTGVDDAADDGDVAYVIVTPPATSSDPKYSGMNAPDISLTNTDNDTAGITVIPTSGLVTTEPGGKATFTLLLASQPATNVTIGLISSDTTEGTVAPASLTFTAANWNVPQTVTVTGVNDDLYDGDIAYTIVTTAAMSIDPAYSGLNPPDVALTNADNDVAGFTVTPTTGLATTEAGGTAAFSIVLTSQPTASVSIGLSSSDSTEGTVFPSSFTFTTTNWNVPQTATVTGVNDFVADGDIAYSIVTAPATGTDPNYNNLNPADVSVTNRDNDTAGITVNPTSALVTTESGGAATFTVVLTSQPAANVTIGLNSSDITEGTISAPSLTFTAANWNTPQIVTITGVDDSEADGDIAYSIITAPAVSTDSKYAGMNAADVLVTNRDDGLRPLIVASTGHIHIKLVGSEIQAFNNDDGSGSPAKTQALSKTTTLTVNGIAGADRITLGFADGNFIPTGGMSLHAGDGLDTLVFKGVEGYQDLDIGTSKISFGGKSVSISSLESVQVVQANNVVLASSFKIAAGLSFDLGNGKMILKNGNIDEIRTAIKSGRLVRVAAPYTTLAAMLNDNDNQGHTPIKTRFAGQSVLVTDVLVKYTWDGDANLDGLINADDYFQIDSGFITQKGGWYNGDFNYDNTVNADDYFLIDSAFIGQSGPLAASKPEPAVSADVAVQQKVKKADPDGILSQLFSTQPVL